MSEGNRLAIHELQRLPDLDSAAVDRFLEGRTFPLVEGPCLTLVYRGEADAVNLRHFIYGLPSTQAFERVEGTDLWFNIFELPDGSRVEYKIEVIRGDDRTWIRDPLNPNLAHDPFGANSVMHARGYALPEWVEHDDDARPGSLEHHVLPSAAFGDKREVTVYIPARFRRSRVYPLLIVHDGPDFLRYASFKTVLDNLIHRLEIPSMVVALTHPRARLDEYPNNPAHARYLTEELVPYLAQRFPISAQPGRRGLMGASFGGVAALSTAWRYPGFYGRLLLQSGSFAFTDIGKHERGPAFDPVVRFVNEFRDNPLRLSDKLFVSCGRYESLIYENRSLVPLLQATGMDVRFVESRDGHNWENWRDRLREGLSWLFPGPLWMVYE